MDQHHSMYKQANSSDLATSTQAIAQLYTLLPQAQSTQEPCTPKSLNLASILPRSTTTTLHCLPACVPKAEPSHCNPNSIMGRKQPRRSNATYAATTHDRDGEQAKMTVSYPGSTTGCLDWQVTGFLCRARWLLSTDCIGVR